MLSREERRLTLKLCDKEHPIFKAHFPENPILPGFVLLELSALAFGLAEQEISRAKFLHTVLPEETLVFLMEEKEASYKVIVTKGEAKVAEIVYAKQ